MSVDLPTPFDPNYKQPNLAPKSTYELPSGDLALPDGVREMLRVHPLVYAFPNGERYVRCPTCEEWTDGTGCEVRVLAGAGEFAAARRLHEEREWPAQTGKANTLFKGQKPDYQLVTFRYGD